MSTDTPRPERVTLTDDLAALIKAHDFSRVECSDHDGHCCPESGCHDVTEHQYVHLARILAAREQALREERDAARAALDRVEALVSGEGRPGVAYGAVPFKPRGMDSLVLHLAHVRVALRGETR